MCKARLCWLVVDPQSNGITLTFIEQSGLIQTAENLGLLSKISDRCALPSHSCIWTSWASKTLSQPPADAPPTTWPVLSVTARATIADAVSSSCTGVDPHSGNIDDMEAQVVLLKPLATQRNKSADVARLHGAATRRACCSRSLSRCTPLRRPRSTSSPTTARRSLWPR